MATPPSISRASARRGNARDGCAYEGDDARLGQPRDWDDGDDDYDEEEEEEEAMGAHGGLGYCYYASPTSGSPSTPRTVQVRVRIGDAVGARALIFEILSVAFETREGD